MVFVECCTALSTFSFFRSNNFFHSFQFFSVHFILCVRRDCYCKQQKQRQHNELNASEKKSLIHQQTKQIEKKIEM